MSIQPRSKVNESIQGLRGLAALTVMLVHVHFMSARVGFTQLHEDAWIYHAAGYSVVLFFCISGYLIVGTLNRSGDVRKFAYNRVIRIYPVFLLLHLIMFGLGPLMNYEWMGSLRSDPAAWAAHFFSNLFFLPGIFRLPLAQKNAWSLSYEAAFYIFTACIFVGQRTWSALRGKLLILLSMAGIIAVATIEVKIVFFALGTLVWWLERRGHLRLPWAGVTGILGVAAGFVLYCLDLHVLSALCVFPFFAGLVLQTGISAALLRTRPFVWLGKVSFSLYLVHPFVLDPIRRLCVKLAERTSTPTAHALFVTVGIPLAIIAAGLSYEFIEIRLTRWLFHRPEIG
jgi:peptidoglycan/LPS O-acetylase OafA/YrhL